MSVELDRKQLHFSASSSVECTASGRADAAFAIDMLGAKARLEVPTATTLHFGQWLGWPDWLRTGTTLQGSGPLPRTVTLADDLIIIGNIIDNADQFALVERMLTAPRPVMGSTGVLSLLHAPDLNSALRTLVRAMAAQNPFVDIALEETHDQVFICLSPPWPMGPLFQFTAMTGLALIHRAIEALSCADPAEMTLETHLHDIPEASAALAAFRCQIRPSAGVQRLGFPIAWKASANPDYDPLLWAVAQTKIAALESMTGEPDDVAQIRAAIARMLADEHRVPRLKQISMALNISSRTMLRQLSRHDTSFHQLVEQERKARALPLIADCTLSLAETARLLGFTDMSSFGRSFRQWFGDTPGNMRKAWQTGSQARI
jgi:AraC-like DNA-binding protein